MLICTNLEHSLCLNTSLPFRSSPTPRSSSLSFPSFNPFPQQRNIDKKEWLSHATCVAHSL